MNDHPNRDRAMAVMAKLKIENDSRQASEREDLEFGVLVTSQFRETADGLQDIRSTEQPLSSCHWLLDPTEDVGKFKFKAPYVDQVGYVPNSIRDIVGAKYHFGTHQELFPYLRMVVRAMLRTGVLVAAGYEIGKELSGKQIDVPQDRWNFIEPDFDANTVSCEGEVIMRGVTVSRRQSAPVNKGGAKPKADWQAYEMEFRNRVERIGYPDSLNDADWRSQADVERWLGDLAQKESGPLGERTIRQHASVFMKKYRPV